MNKSNRLSTEMGKLVLSASRDIASYYCTFFLLSLLLVNATGRYLHDTASELVSDGISDRAQQEESSFLRLKGMEYSSKEYYCSDQMYGFLPCSSTLAGNLFLVVLYEYLLFQGESLVVSGGARLFEIFRRGIFGASVFPVIGPLPESLILLTSGLMSSKEEAQEYVLTGVGLLAGSTIFLLTVLWGTCVIFGSQKPSNDRQNEHERSWLSWIGSSVTTDAETSDTARIMLLSLMPFIIILIPKIFAVSYSSGGYKIDILITLIVSVISLLAYFYKMSDKHIQGRRLLYVEEEHILLLLDIIQHVQEHISESLVNEDGTANEVAIRRLFKKMDKNDDNHISYLEIKALLEEIKLSKLAWNWEKVMDKLIKEFDRDGDERITREKFHHGFKKWLDEIKDVLDETDYTEVARRLIEKSKHKEMMKYLTSEMSRHSHGTQLGNLPINEEALRKVFESIDEDNDSSISLSELRKQFMDLDLRDISLDEGEAAKKIMNDFDKNKNGELDVEEFMAGIKQWHHSTINPAPTSLEHAINRHQIAKQRMRKEVDKSRSAKIKVVTLLVLGIAILVVLSEPLIHSVQKFSTSIGIPSFYVAFILVPLATNARTAISAIRVARGEEKTDASLTFSEIYHGVFLNNILGMSVLLSVIYFRGLTWHFSFEVLAAFVVCVIMGLLASFQSKFPIWTSSIAYMLYALSLILVYILNDAYQSP